jgi:sterol-4alpha-carboxylate 3-dehydrogenase (decarboxylating)
VITRVEMAFPIPAVEGFDRREPTRWCAVTGGRGFTGRHLVAALLRSGKWRVRITDLAPMVSLDPAEQEGLLGAALRDGLAVYTSVNVCDLGQLIKGSLCISIISTPSV